MREIEETPKTRPPSLADSLVAVGALIALIAASFLLFGEDATFGPTQVALKVTPVIVICLEQRMPGNVVKERRVSVVSIDPA
jgi:NhaC family Na+:H+ antiporter